MNVLSEVRRALIARLGTITVGNGYLTNVGTRVKAGWFNEVIKQTEVGSGLLVVQKAKGLAPVRSGVGLRPFPGFVVIGAVETGLDGYEDAIEDIELDLLGCLTTPEGLHADWLPKGSTKVTVGAPEPMPPGEGLAAATVLVPIHFSVYIESHDY